MSGGVYPRRVLVAAWGSAGDVFPLVPLIERLASAGHEVRCAVPRSLALFTRARGVRTYGLGRGEEFGIFDDGRTVTARFGGWASWRQLTSRYLASSLRADVGTLGRAFVGWRPDVVVCGSFSTAARVAAHLGDIPRVDVTIYPQHPRRTGRARSFGWALRTAVVEMCEGAGGARSDLVSELGWGAGGGVVLHDRAVLGDLEDVGDVAGFPYWDDGPRRPSDGEAVDRWLDGVAGPAVAVTLGSFLGVRQRHVWEDAAKAVEALGVRAVFVGPWRRGADHTAVGGADVLRVGFVPMSRIAGRVDAVVHHGGVGTMFGVLRAGCPAVIVPQAFDQPFNARLIARLGAGVEASSGSLRDALETVLDGPVYRTAARAVAGKLVPSEAATERAAARVMETAS